MLIERLISNFRHPSGLRDEQRGHPGSGLWIRPAAAAPPAAHIGRGERGQPAAPAAAGQAAGAPASLSLSPGQPGRGHQLPTGN